MVSKCCSNCKDVMYLDGGTLSQMKDDDIVVECQMCGKKFTKHEWRML